MILRHFVLRSTDIAREIYGRFHSRFKLEAGPTVLAASINKPPRLEGANGHSEDRGRGKPFLPLSVLSDILVG